MSSNVVQVQQVIGKHALASSGSRLCCCTASFLADVIPIIAYPTLHTQGLQDDGLCSNSAAPVADAAQISSLADSVHALQSSIGAKAAFATADEVNNLAEAVRAVQSSLQSLDHLVQEHVSSGDTHEADTASKLQQVHASVGSLHVTVTSVPIQR